MDKSSNRTQQLANENVLKLILKFSIPSIIAMTVNAIYNIVDRMFVSKFVGEAALGGLTVAFPIMLIIMAFGGMIGVGVSANISMCLGAKKEDAANKYFGNSITMMLIITAVLSVIGYLFLDNLLKINGGSPENIGFAKDYLSIILIGTLPQMASFVLSSIARVEGKPILSMVTQIISAIINVVLDYVFIALLDMGVKGAAIATIIGQGVGFLILVYFYFFSKKSLVKFKAGYLLLKWKYVKNIFMTGSGNFFMQLGASVSTSFITVALFTYGGDPAVNSLGAINSLFTLILMPLLGLQQGVAPIIGYNYGAKKIKRAKSALIIGIIIGMCFSTTMFILMQVFPKSFVSLFLDPDSTTIAVCIDGLRKYILLLPFLPINILSTAFFQSTNQAKKSLLVGMSRQWLFLIPAAIIMPPLFGLDGAWLAGAVSDLMSIILAVTLLLICFKTKFKNSDAIKVDKSINTNAL